MKQRIKSLIKALPGVASNSSLARRLFRPRQLYLLSGSTRPLSAVYGYDRGTPIDRFYIESFLHLNSSNIKGRCLEIRNNDYTLRFGGQKVTVSDILDVDPKNHQATITADLQSMPQVPDDSYDCIILTQVLQYMREPRKAAHECRRILRRDGILLITLPALGRVDPEAGLDGDYWRFTRASASSLFDGFSYVEIESYGNVRTAMLYLIGAAQEDIPRRLLTSHDPWFPVIISIAAKR